jgi:hypothetical protein
MSRRKLYPIFAGLFTACLFATPLASMHRISCDHTSIFAWTKDPLKTDGPLGRTTHKDVESNMEPTCSRIVTPKNLLVDCKLEEYDRITRMGIGL